MKTKNDLKTGILIGIGMIVIPLFLMGTTYTTEKQKKYELHTTESGSCYRINTETGVVDYIKGSSKVIYTRYTLEGPQ